MKIASLFAGAGGLDLGFKKAGFDVVWANEYDSTIWSTFEQNFPGTVLDKRSVVDVPASEIPDVEGIVGGPPCQSWSEAGARRGINDKRGQLFFDYIRILQEKQPKFFLAENVSGMLHPKNIDALHNIISQFEGAGFQVTWKLLNAHDFEVPEDRQRVIIVGYKKVLNKTFEFPEPIKKKLVLRDAIGDLPEAMPCQSKNKTNGAALSIPNHEFMNGGFSSIYMSRNRVRSWDEPSFTIQAGGRHAPLHPKAPKMELVERDVRRFVSGQEGLYRRLSVRECARIQTFPDDFVFHYTDVSDGYKMIGNAVPVRFAYHLARKIFEDLGGSK
jgi:DNA (cytosine-5)-methyltransferase 1